MAHSRLGSSVAYLGWRNGDFILDFAVGAPGVDSGSGIVYLWFSNASSPVGYTQLTEVISPSPPPAANALFGASLASMGNLDGDKHGTPDLAVGAPGNETSSSSHLYFFFLRPDGTVASQKQVSSTPNLPSFTGLFPSDLAALGDVNGDGVPDLAGTAPGSGTGAVLLMLLQNTGEPRHDVLVRNGTGSDGVPFPNDESWRFGRSLAALGDVNGDSVVDLAVGVDGQQTAPNGGVVLLFLTTDLHIAHYRILDSADLGLSLPNITGLFGDTLAPAGDVDGDGVPDLLSGAPSFSSHTVHTVLLGKWGTIRKISSFSPLDCQGAGVPSGAGFGSSILALQQPIPGAGGMQLLFGARGLLGGGSLPDAGGMYLANTTLSPSVQDSPLTTGWGDDFVRRVHPITGTSLAEGGSQSWPALSRPGTALANIHMEVRPFGPPLVAVGLPGYSEEGAFVMLIRLRDGVEGGGPTAELFANITFDAITLRPNADDGWGSSLASADWNMDGVGDLAVGAPNRGGDDGQAEVGVVYVLYLTDTGSVNASAELSNRTLSSVTPRVPFVDQGRFGTGIAAMEATAGAFPGLAISMPGCTVDNDAQRGCLVFLRPGSGGSWVSPTLNLFNDTSHANVPAGGQNSRLGSSLHSLGFQGSPEHLILSTVQTEVGVKELLLFLFITPGSLTVSSAKQMSHTTLPLTDVLTPDCGFGSAVAVLPPQNWTIHLPIAVSAPRNNSAFPGAGVVFILDVNIDAGVTHVVVKAARVISGADRGLVGFSGTNDSFAGSMLAFPDSAQTRMHLLTSVRPHAIEPELWLLDTNLQASQPQRLYTGDRYDHARINTSTIGLRHVPPGSGCGQGTAVSQHWPAETGLSIFAVGCPLFTQGNLTSWGLGSQEDLRIC